MKSLFYILSLGLFLISCSENKEDEYTLVIESHELLEIPQPIIDSLKGGEIIMRKGDGFVSTQIVKVLNEPVEFSHCGFIIKTDSSKFIMHSLGRDYGDRDGVQPCSFKNFLADAVDSSVCIVRPLLNDSLLKRIQIVAMEYYDQEYAFDYSFDLATKDKLHCTEFIHNVLIDAIGREIFPVEKTPSGVDCLMFKNFFNPEYFETVYTMKPLPEITF